MQAKSAPTLGVIDAIMAGLRLAARRPLLLVIPVTVDLLLWTAPQLSVGSLIARFLDGWESLVRGSYPPAQAAAAEELITAVRGVLTQAGSEINLAELLTGGWLSPPSALALSQGPRQTFISDVILAPTGLGLNLPRLMQAPWQPPALQLSSVWMVALVIAGLWIVGQLLVTFYIRWAATDWNSAQATGEAVPQGLAGPREDLRGFLALAGRLAGFSLLLGFAVMMLRMPLAVTMTLMLFSGSAATAVLFAVIGALTLWVLLWFLTAAFFTCEAIVLDKQTVSRGALQSLGIARGQALSAFWLVFVINLMLLGFRAIWGMVGQSPAGAILAIVGNAYLVTATLFAIFFYYFELKRRSQSRVARVMGRTTRKGMGGPGTKPPEE